MRVIAMTPEQINMLPPPERAGITQLVSDKFQFSIFPAQHEPCTSGFASLSFPFDIDARHSTSSHGVHDSALFLHVSTFLVPASHSVQL